MADRWRWLKALFAPDRRRLRRRRVPGMVAHYFDGGSPRPHNVLDINSGGSFLQTEERGYPGMVLRITLQSRVESGGRAPALGGVAHIVMVLAEMVRSGRDGIGLRFLFPGEMDPGLQALYPACPTTRQELTAFLKWAEANASSVSFSVE